VNILLVEDDHCLRQALVRLLKLWGYAVEAASTGYDALAWLDQHPIDLLILDLGLPDIDGVELCEQVRSTICPQPLVLLLTARDSSSSTVQGLESGADDYVVKPFEPEVLRARLKALLRRAHRPLTSELTWGPLRMRPGDLRVMVDAISLDLTRKEALLLELLLSAQGCSRTKAQLLRGCTDHRREVSDDALRAHMRNLRQKLTLAGCAPNLIETVYGLGYRLNPLAGT